MIYCLGNVFYGRIMMNNDKNNNDFELNTVDTVIDMSDAQRKAKRTKTIIIVAFALMVAFVVACFTIPGLLDGTMFEKAQNADTHKQYLFYDEYPEDFDILQYDILLRTGTRQGCLLSPL